MSVKIAPFPTPKALDDSMMRFKHQFGYVEMEGKELKRQPPTQSKSRWPESLARSQGIFSEGASSQDSKRATKLV